MNVVKLKGEEYPFLFAIKAQKEVQKTEVIDKDDIYFIWLGFKYGAKKEGKEFPFTEDALEDIFENDMEAYAKSCELLGEDMGTLKKLKALAMKGLE
jgi:hypothetical protein